MGTTRKYIDPRSISTAFCSCDLRGSSSAHTDFKTISRWRQIWLAHCGDIFSDPLVYRVPYRYAENSGLVKGHELINCDHLHRHANKSCLQ
jgi:hypothetical protein